MARNISIAFAGSGEVKKETVRSLLDDFLGFGPQDADGYPEPSENEIRVIIPVSVEHTNDGLQTVIDWTEYADLPYEAVLAKGDRDDSLERIVTDADKVYEVANVDKKVVDLLKDAEGEKFLVILWSDSDPHCEILLDLASTAGVKALDLTAALDDLSFEEEGAPEPEPEPEPEKPVRGRRGSRRGSAEAEDPEPAAEPEKPARGRRRGSKEETLVEAEERLTEDAEPELPVEEEPEPVATAADVAASAEIVEQSDVVLSVQTLDAEYLSGALQSIFLHLQAADAAAAYRNLGDPQESPVTALAREALEHVSLGSPAAEEEAEPVKRGRGRPRNKPVEEETVGYLKNADGIHRKAGRGRPRRGEEKVDLTVAEVADLMAQGLILPEED